MTTFSVIMPTRNRPALFEVALESVLVQRAASFEIVIVMDGSAPEHDASYAALEAKARETVPVQVVRLARTARGHGQSYAINRGADSATGKYLCFLDDDDNWIDPDHLMVAAALLDTGAADIYLTDQEAWRGDVRVTTAEGIWIEALGYLSMPSQSAIVSGAQVVDADVLMQINKHCHLNTTIVARSLYQEIGGMDEDIRYDCDRDFYLRAVDGARKILYNRRTVSRHNIPDPSQKTNMSTSASTIEKYLYQLKVFDKSMLFAQRASVSAHARRAKGYVLRNIAVALASERRWALASAYAGEALGLRPSVKWLGYCGWLRFKALLCSGSPRHGIR